MRDTTIAIGNHTAGFFLIRRTIRRQPFSSGGREWLAGEGIDVFPIGEFDGPTVGIEDEV
jgi:hypothetical protein